MRVRLLGFQIIEAMTVSKNIIGSVDLLGLTDEELSGLIRMIEGASLPKRRMFDRLKNDLKAELSPR